MHEPQRVLSIDCSSFNSIGLVLPLQALFSFYWISVKILHRLTLYLIFRSVYPECFRLEYLVFLLVSPFSLSLSIIYHIV